MKTRIDISSITKIPWSIRSYRVKKCVVVAITLQSLYCTKLQTNAICTKLQTNAIETSKMQLQLHTHDKGDCSSPCKLLNTKEGRSEDSFR